MFTGIIQKLGRVNHLTPKDSKLVLETGYPDLELGESVAVNGVCLTVIESDSNGLAHFTVSEETFACSNLGKLKERNAVNLERALTLSTRLSGHLVQGHVDGIGTISKVSPAPGDCFQVQIQIPDSLTRYCVEKGSIGINGISLTINKIHESFIELMIIPHTWEHTNLSTLEPGDLINLEVDVLAKYVERLLSCRN